MHRQANNKTKAQKKPSQKKTTRAIAPRRVTKATIMTKKSSTPLNNNFITNNITSAKTFTTRSTPLIQSPQQIKTRHAILRPSFRQFSTDESGEGQSRHAKMTELITADFQPSYLNISDTSGGCGAFYQITVVSTKFEGKMTLARHRAVQTTLKDIIPQIHGLNLFTHTPAQWEKQVNSTPAGSV